MERPLSTARLESKLLLSSRAQCFHLEFSIDGVSDFPFAAGQFISIVADDKLGKAQTRAYSLASAPRGNRFDLCVNRVVDGFFSNLLCDLEPGQTIPFHGPHGLFTLRATLTDSILIATDTGIAPMLGFVQHLFPEHGPDRSNGHNFWLLYGAQEQGELYYRPYFESVAAAHPNFHYQCILSAPRAGWEGERGPVQELAARLIAQRKAARVPDETPQPETAESFNIHAYICGLNEMVSANREQLKTLGWQRKQIVYERYD